MELHKFQLLHFIPNKDLLEMYWAIALRNFGNMLVGVFFPIYLYTLGYSIPTIFIFYGIASLIAFLFCLPVVKLASKIGAKHCMLLGTLLLLLVNYFFFSLENMHWDLWMMAIPFGLSWILFWIGYWLEFAESTDLKHRGEAIGTSSSLIAFMHILGPMLAGIIILVFGFSSLFLIGIFVYLLSIIPLALDKRDLKHFTFSPRLMLSFLKPHYLAGMTANAVNDGLGRYIVWPLFVFIVLGSTLEFGAFTTIALVFAFLATYLLSHYADKIKKTSILFYGAILEIFSWFIRAFANTPALLFFVYPLTLFSFNFVHIPFNALLINEAQTNHIEIEAVVMHELVYYAAAFLAAFFFAWLNNLSIAIIIIGVTVSLFFYYLQTYKKMHPMLN